jgi:hypothetical protein
MLTSSSIYFQNFKNFEVGGPLFIPTNDKTFSSHGFDFTFFFPLFFYYNFDISNAYHTTYVLMSLNGFSPNPKNNLPIPSKVRIKKENYYVTRKI